MKSYFFSSPQSLRHVRVYRNLKNADPNYACWSVLDKVSKKVILHCADVVLLQGHFVVSETGRQRVLKNKCKNVHAYAEGVLKACSVITERYPVLNPMEMITENSTRFFAKTSKLEHEVTYNPYKYDSFVFVDSGESVTFTEMDIYLRSDNSVSVMINSAKDAATLRGYQMKEA